MYSNYNNNYVYVVKIIDVQTEIGDKNVYINIIMYIHALQGTDQFIMVGCTVQTDILKSW